MDHNSRLELLIGKKVVYSKDGQAILGKFIGLEHVEGLGYARVQTVAANPKKNMSERYLLVLSSDWRHIHEATGDPQLRVGGERRIVDDRGTLAYEWWGNRPRLPSRILVIGPRSDLEPSVNAILTYGDRQDSLGKILDWSWYNEDALGTGGNVRHYSAFCRPENGPTDAECANAQLVILAGNQAALKWADLAVDANANAIVLLDASDSRGYENALQFMIDKLASCAKTTEGIPCPVPAGHGALQWRIGE